MKQAKTRNKNDKCNFYNVKEISEKKLEFKVKQFKY